MAYFNNNIIYLSNKKEHKIYIEWVLQRLYKKKILVAIKKCKFYIKKINFYRIYY